MINRLLTTAILIAVSLAGVVTHADDGMDEDQKATELFTKGRELYGQGKYKEAIEKLEQAFKLRPAPPILLNIGRTYEKLKQPKMALASYRRFLYKARYVDPNREIVTQMLRRLEKQLGVKPMNLAELATPAAKQTTQQKKKTRPSLLQLIHTPVDNGTVKKPITLQAELPPDLEVDAVVIFWRKAGQRNFRKIPMRVQGEGYIGDIPGRYVTTTSVQYYLVAQKAGAGKRGIVAAAGSRRTPNIIVIEGGRAPHLGPVNTDIRSPYRTLLWASAGTALATIAGATAFLILAADRSSAIETRAKQSCPAGTCSNPAPKLRFNDGSARDFESQGKTFSLVGTIFVGVSVAAVGVTGYLWFKDRAWIKKEKRRLLDEAAAPAPRFVAMPWVAEGAAGIVSSWRF